MDLPLQSLSLILAKFYPEELRILGEVACKHNLIISCIRWNLSDIVYPYTFTSIASLDESIRQTNHYRYGI